MRVILTEQQVQKLADNVSDLDLAKDAPELMKVLNKLNIGDKNIEPTIPYRKGYQQTFSQDIPQGDEPMHPLGGKYPISSQFGQRNVPVGSTNHKGVDIAAPSGSPVYAPLDGFVVAAKDSTPNPCGGFIQLDHSNMITKFCHLKQLTVKNGQQVKKGQLIGYSGGGLNDPMKGTSTGPHLHYAILNKNGIALNPIEVQQNLAENESRR